MKTAREGKSASTSANHRKGELTRVSSYSDSDLVDFPPESWTIPQFFSTFVPEYKSKVYGPIIASLEWDVRYPAQILGISQKRADRRCDNYLSTDEIIRVKKKLQSKHEAAIRFGELKRGHGYKKERGDFCLVGGAWPERRSPASYALACVSRTPSPAAIERAMSSVEMTPTGRSVSGSTTARWEMPFCAISSAAS